MTPLTLMARGPRRHILVTGAAGYLGGALVRDLLALGHDVTAVDTMIFGERALTALLPHPALKLRRMDVRGLQREHLAGVHAIVDLAGIADAAAAELDPVWTHAVNHLARVRLAQLAPAAGVQRYILASSCCVYGDVAEPGAEGPLFDETSPTRPTSAYARANLKAEAAVLPLARPGFAPTVLRLASCHGLAPRTRFDLPVNAATEQALRERRITLHGDGQSLHPLVHVDDVVQAIIATLGAPLVSVARQIFNVGAGQLSQADIARSVRLVLGSHIAIVAGPERLLPAGQRVDFDKVHRLLGWQPQRELLQTIAELLDALDAGQVDTGPTTRTAHWYEQALAGRQILQIETEPATVIAT
jgi:nucleoside-diphosphate-sugar epimerase